VLSIYYCWVTYPNAKGSVKKKHVAPTIATDAIIDIETIKNLKGVRSKVVFFRRLK
jgi:thiamine biosynthesis protein ThiC